MRAATGTATSRANCHPFAHGQHLFMHNGQVGAGSAGAGGGGREDGAGGLGIVLQYAGQPQRDTEAKQCERPPPS